MKVQTTSLQGVIEATTRRFVQSKQGLDGTHIVRAPIIPRALQRFLYSAYSWPIRKLRSNRRLYRLLFGFAPRTQAGQFGEYWDWTTLVLKSVLTRYCTQETRLLDLGTGPTGVLAIYANRCLQCNFVRASDHVPEVVDSALLQAQNCEAQVSFFHGDLFQNIPERFDLILFNAPYLSRDRSQSLGLSRARYQDLRFVGGDDGCETIRRFLTDVPQHLTPDGVAALGVTPFHIPRARILALLSKAGLVCESELTVPFVPSRAYILRSSDYRAMRT